MTTAKLGPNGADQECGLSRRDAAEREHVVSYHAHIYWLELNPGSSGGPCSRAAGSPNASTTGCTHEASCADTCHGRLIYRTVLHARQPRVELSVVRE
jgi:hypothetical protein